MNCRLMQGIGSFQPFLEAAQAAQTAGLGTIGAGAQTVAGAEFVQQKTSLDHLEIHINKQ